MASKRNGVHRPARSVVGVPGLAFVALAVALALCPAELIAQVFPGPPGGWEKANIQVASDRAQYAPGSPVEIRVEILIEEGWHTNSNQPTFDYLIPTEVVVDLPPSWSEGVEMSYPIGEVKAFAFADQPLSVYEGGVVLEGRTHVPDSIQNGLYDLRIATTYQACDDRSCLPPVTDEQILPIQVSSEAPTVSAAPRTEATEAAGGGWIHLLLGVVGGLILNAMPCVLPVLSLKIFGLLQHAGEDRRKVVNAALTTSLGILVSFWALAAFAIAVRAAGGLAGWGVQFQQPGFVAALAVLVLLFSLNLWGVFEIQLPGRLLAGTGQPREGWLGHFSTGLFATLMATPCSAPFLGTAVGFALSQSKLQIFLTFTAIGLGMALPYLLVAAVPGVMRWLPKPGPWMIHLKLVLGFLLSGALVWLFYVLAGQISAERLALVQLGLVLLALLVWARAKASRSTLWRGALGVAVLGAVALTVAVPASSGPRPEKTQVAARLLDWKEFDRSAAESAAASGRLVFVDVTADWCFTCKVNERLVLETQPIAEAFERWNVLAMKADWTNRDPAIAEFLASHGRYSIPFYVLYRPHATPHLFSELLTKEAILRELEATSPGQQTAQVAR